MSRKLVSRYLDTPSRKTEDLLVELEPELVRGAPLGNVLRPFRSLYLVSESWLLDFISILQTTCVSQ